MTKIGFHASRHLVEEAKLYVRSATRSGLAGAAVTAKTAEWLGPFAGALITTACPPGEMHQEDFIDTFAEKVLPGLS